jgi:KUP system potassium uptake protein
VLHERVLLVAVAFAEVPRVSTEQRADVTPVCDSVTRVELRYGYMEQPDVPLGLGAAVAQGKIDPCNLDSVMYFTGHETVVALGKKPGMAHWRESMFALMHRNAQRPGAYFRIPSPQIMEIGVEFEI